MQPRNASFLESAFALSDAYERGLVTNLESFENQCRSVAEEIAGSKPDKWTDFISSEAIPVVMRMSLNALLNGLVSNENQLSHVSSPPAR